MSTAELTNDSESLSFTEELAERAADQSPIWGVPRILATKNQWAIQTDARQRLHDARRAECRALGLEDPGPLKDDMGDILVVHNIDVSTPGSKVKIGKHEISAGDKPVAIAETPPPPKTEPTNEPVATDPAKPAEPAAKPNHWWLPLLLAGVGGGSLLGGMALNHFLYQPDPQPTVVTSPDQDYQLGVEVRPHKE